MEQVLVFSLGCRIICYFLQGSSSSRFLGRIPLKRSGIKTSITWFTPPFLRKTYAMMRLSANSKTIHRYMISHKDQKRKKADAPDTRTY